jgi:hypothetical protein
VLLFGWCAKAATPRSADSREFVLIPVSVRNDPNFADVRVQLQAMVNTLGFRNRNQFCVFGYRSRDEDVLAPYIYWPTQNKIANWEEDPDHPVLYFSNYSDLRRDILPDGEVTDNYLHQSDVKRIIKDCREHGDFYTIEKTQGGWVAVGHYPEFSTIDDQLQYLTDQSFSPKVNRFCVIGQKDGAFLAAYIYWQTKERLIFWYPGRSDYEGPYEVADSVFQIDLKSGLRDQEDSKDEMNEMQRSYAEGILKACQKRGKEYVIKKPN